MRKIIFSVFTGLLIGCSSEPEIKLPDVKQVGMGSADKMIQAAGLKPVEKITSTDSKNDPKQIYKFDGVFTQLEHSKNFVTIAWHQNDNDSLDKAVRLGIASLGNDAGYFIHKVDLNGQHTEYSIAGHKIDNNTCISKLCSIRIMQ